MGNNIPGLRDIVEDGLEVRKVDHIRRRTKATTNMGVCTDEETLTYIVTYKNGEDEGMFQSIMECRPRPWRRALGNWP